MEAAETTAAEFREYRTLFVFKIEGKNQGEEGKNMDRPISSRLNNVENNKVFWVFFKSFLASEKNWRKQKSALMRGSMVDT